VNFLHPSAKNLVGKIFLAKTETGKLMVEFENQKTSKPTM